MVKCVSPDTDAEHTLSPKMQTKDFHAETFPQHFDGDLIFFKALFRRRQFSGVLRQILKIEICRPLCRVTPVIGSIFASSSLEP